MQFHQRIKYSFYLAISTAALFALVIVVASADSVELIPTASFDLVQSPIYFLVIFAVSYAFAPIAARRVDISGYQAEPSESGAKSRSQLDRRTISLVLVGLFVVFLANLLVFLLLWVTFMPPSPNKGFNRTPVSLAEAKPVELSGGAG
jgi:hypothetical protein